MNNLVKIVIALSLVIALFSLLRTCESKKEIIDKILVTSPTKTVEVKLVTKLDTIYIKRYIHTVDTIRVPTLVKADTVFINGSKTVAMIPNIKRQYSDSVKRDSVTISYFAQTHGTLDRIVLDYKDHKAEKTIIRTDSVFTTTTITKPNTGIYIGISGGYQELSPNLQYIRGDNSYGIHYNIVNQGVGVTYNRRLW